MAENPALHLAYEQFLIWQTAARANGLKVDANAREHMRPSADAALIRQDVDPVAWYALIWCDLGFEDFLDFMEWQDNSHG